MSSGSSVKFESVLSSFRCCAELDPAAIAIRCNGGNKTVTYGDLEKRVSRVTRGLHAMGIGKGCRVAILLKRSPDWICGCLAVLEAGATFVPLDPTHPIARNQWISRSAGISLMIAEADLNLSEWDNKGICCSMSEIIDASSDDLRHHQVSIDELDPAYIIYTSGTTGNPKGVVIPHRALANYIYWARETYVAQRKGQEKPFAAMPFYSSVAVDLTITSVFLPLISGGEVVVYQNESTLQALYEVLEDDRVDILKVTPSHLWLVLAYLRKSERKLKCLRCLVVGGEALPCVLALRAKEELGSELNLFNEYGPTEATVGCLVHHFNPEVDATYDTVPIGKSITGMDVHLLDSEGNHAEEEGEICLSGKGLALGYLGAPRTTNQKFINNQGKIMYRTGDRGRRTFNNSLVFLGRLDDQVKFNGHRIELEGLRCLLQRNPQVEDCVVRLQETEDLRTALVCYAVAPGTTTLKLRHHLELHLPMEHIPQHFILLHQLPTGSGGKLDVSKLPTLDQVLLKAASRNRTDMIPARNQMEQKLTEIWRDVLGLEEVGIEDDFFELGGHSLLAHNIIVSIRETFGVDLNMRGIAENRTISAIASRLSQAQDEGKSTLSSNNIKLPELEASKSTICSNKSFSGRQSDEETLMLAASTIDVDRVVGDFYSRFPWPWNSSKFEMPADPDFEITMINQELGDFDHTLLHPAPSIWVAGCGTNQALMSALRFPKAKILGTDLSTSSLEICRKNAAEVGVKNLTLRHESINDATYKDEFDFVICTGVIHYTYDPTQALAQLARALKPNGVMELLVYNRFHRTVTSAFQKSVRLLTRNLGADDFAIAQRLASGLSVDNQLSQFVARHRDWQESDSSDLLINPVEHSFTVDSLVAMADDCGLELVRPCTSLYSKFRAETLEWEMPFEDPDLRRVYCSMTDTDRWRVSNLLLHEKSPMLWFYLRRKDAAWDRKTEKELAHEMLQSAFVKACTQQKVFLPDKNGVFRPSSGAVAYPSGAPDPSVHSIWAQFDFERPRLMRDVLAELGIPTTFEMLHSIRQKLTIPAFPYLKAVPLN